jgi:hypothetical protein
MPEKKKKAVLLKVYGCRESNPVVLHKLSFMVAVFHAPHPLFMSLSTLAIYYTKESGHVCDLCLKTDARTNIGHCHWSRRISFGPSSSWTVGRMFKLPRRPWWPSRRCSRAVEIFLAFMTGLGRDRLARCPSWKQWTSLMFWSTRVIKHRHFCCGEICFL